MPITPINEFTEIRAPHPNHKTTSILPKPQFQDSRRSEARLTVRRTMTGGQKRYIDSSNRIQLTLPFLLTRQKSLEVEALFQSYQSAHVQLTLYDGTTWDAQLVGQPLVRNATDRYAVQHGITGRDLVEVTLVFSAVQLS